MTPTPPIRRISRGLGLIAIALVIAGCAPAVSIHNGTTFAIRVIVISGSTSEVFSPSPGEDSSGDVSEGHYHATAILDREWIAWATATRAYLNDRLAQPDSMTGAQLLDVVQRLKDIAAKMKAYEDAAGSLNGCEGSVSSDANGQVTVTQAPDGSLRITCT